MRAAVLPEIPSMLEVAEIQVDQPGPREVLVRTVAAGLCHSDLHFMEGKYSHDTPTVPGHEAAGVVEAVGADVTHVKPGDHVIGCLSIFCGRCEYCLSGRPVLCDRQGLERERRPAATPLPGWRPDPPVPAPLGLRRDDARPREHPGEDPRRDAARSRGADRLRRHHRSRRGLQHRQSDPGQHRGRHRLRRRRAQLGAGGGHRRGGAGHRRRHQSLEARAGPDVRRHRSGRRHGRRPGGAGARADGRRGRVLLRGHRAEGDGGAVVRDAAQRGHGDDHRHDPGRASASSCPGRSSWTRRRSRARTWARTASASTCRATSIST